MTKLKGKNAIITGASRGIGRAIAERLAGDGAAVAINYVRDEGAAREVCAAIEAKGGRALAIRADVGVTADIERLFAEAEARLGPPDIVVASAGISVFKPHAMVTAEEFDRIFAVNTRGVFFVLQEAARRVRDGGRIVQISTAGTLVPYPAAGLYSGSKAAAELFASCLAKELGPRGVTVNSVAPGATRTEGLIMPEEAIAQLVAQTPLGRLGEPRDIADVVAFLVSEEGRWLTGQNLHATGGII
ncbi:MAG TPA: SDR family oxidoreductase [Polyangia bacterium]|jgi:3-oxoacyl-[acyl-carrier protein] reductase|nr:SDR family oxidoreductase [Polyangia bacterium]